MLAAIIIITIMITASPLPFPLRLRPSLFHVLSIQSLGRLAQQKHA